MARLRMHQAVALAVLIICLPPVTPASAGCPDHCGNIRNIPYPFGVGVNCARDSSFQLECNHTYSTPRLYLDTQEVDSLSLADGELRVRVTARSNCHDYRFKTISGEYRTPGNRGSTTYRFSAEKNRLVVLGCPVHGYLVDDEGKYVTGCTSMCRQSQRAGDLPGRCTDAVAGPAF